MTRINNYQFLITIMNRFTSLLRIRPKMSNIPIPEKICEVPDLTEEEKTIIDAVKDYTMTTLDRQVSLCRVIDYVLETDIEGDFVECGVWRGGSSMIAAFKLTRYGSDKRIWLYDTFEGMPDPDDKNDISHDDRKASHIMEGEISDKENSLVWAIGTLDEVKVNLGRTGYSSEKIVYVKGDIENTIPSNDMPRSISILRLDTDWYSSTYHELVHFFPLVSCGGFIIIDDYGHWQGAKNAVDQYLSCLNPRPYLHRVDYTCRIIQKPF